MFFRYQIGQDTPQEEEGKRTNKYLGPESRWAECGFNSQAECQAAFQDERYQTDEAYRFAVQVMLKNSPEFAPGQAGSGIQIGNGILERAMSNTEAARQAEDAACWNEYVTGLFNDPRYATSPMYRREVRELIAKHQDQFDASPLGGRVVDRTGQAMRIELTSDAVSETRERLKVEKTEHAKVDAKAVAISAARRAYFSAIGKEDPGQHGAEGISDASIFNNSPETASAE